VKSSPRFIITDSSTSMCLGEGDTEAQAVAATVKNIETSHNTNPHRVMIHDCAMSGYVNRSAVISLDGLLSK